jgi:hypothetical protein
LVQAALNRLAARCGSGLVDAAAGLAVAVQDAPVRLQQELQLFWEEVEQEAERLERREAAERTDPVTIRAREAAKQAFAKYDKDLSGAIDSAELFACLMTMGEVPGVSLIEQQRYLSVEFAKADADGSGSVDYDEFVTFYVKVVRAQEAERAARAAFARKASAAAERIRLERLEQQRAEAGEARRE